MAQPSTTTITSTAATRAETVPQGALVPPGPMSTGSDRSQRRTFDRREPVAHVLRPLADSLLGTTRDHGVRIECWDGSELAPRSEPIATIRFVSPDALRRLLWMPNELGLARAYVVGDIEFEGDLFGTLSALRRPTGRMPSTAQVATAAINVARRLGVLQRPLPPPPEEARLHGWRHSLRRDAQAVGHHYDVGNDFYRLVLGESMTYSCARFVEPTVSLEQAQAAKHDLVCRKLGLHERPGATLLDVGCGWGSMAIHAARSYDARVVGITISREQAAWARRCVDDAGLGDQVEIRLQDYRELGRETFDAVSSVGMSEHVGHRRIDEYFATLRAAVRPGGRLLNHAISSVGGSTLGRTSFVARYVFPDGELVDVGDTVLAMERAGFEVRDVESLREHYARTLRCWVTNLEARWSEAVDLVGETRAKVWRLYMAGSAIGFDDGRLSIHQVLGVVADASGTAGVAPTRRSWETGGG